MHPKTLRRSRTLEGSAIGFEDNSGHWWLARDAALTRVLTLTSSRRHYPQATRITDRSSGRRRFYS